MVATKKMKILGIFAHPDDEIIFGWPIFQQKHLDKHLLCITGRQERLECLHKVSSILNFTWSCPQLTDGYLQGLSNLVVEAIQLNIERYNPALVFCHNSEGEYGHPDHKTIFDAVLKSEAANMVISDIIVPVKSSKWSLVTHISNPEYYQNKICTVSKDETKYEEISQVYQKNNFWTWGHYPSPSECNLYAPRHEISIEELKEICIIEA